jgi:hypothetical protein
MRSKEKNKWWIPAIIGVLTLILGMIAVELGFGYTKRRWDGRTRFTVVDLKNPITIWSVDPTDTTLVKFVLPDDLDVPTIGKGRWSAKSLPELTKKYGVGWAADSLSAFLGIPYTGVAGKMSFWDEASWVLLKRGKSVESVEIEDSNLITKKTAPDGMVSYGLSSLWKKRVGDTFFSSVLASSGWRLSVFNPTGVAGLGAKIARIAETAGYKVVSLSEGKDKPHNCVVLSRKDEREKLGVVWLQRYFNCDLAENDKLGSSELELILGDRFVEWAD